MTHHSDTEISELAEYLVRCCEQSYGASALVMLPAGSVRKAATALRSLLADKARMEEALAWAEDHEPWFVDQIRERAALSTITPKEAE